MYRRPTSLFPWTPRGHFLGFGLGPALGRTLASSLCLALPAAAQLAPPPIGAAPPPVPAATPLPGLRSDTPAAADPASLNPPLAGTSAVGGPAEDAAPNDQAPDDTAAPDGEAAPPNGALDPIPQDDAEVGGEAYAKLGEASQEELAGLAGLIPRFLHFSFAVGAAYDDNIFQSSIDPVGTTILQAQFNTSIPLLTLGKNKLVGSYTALGSLYTDYPDLSGVEQAFSLGADGGQSFQFTLGKNTITLNANYSRPSGGPQGSLGQLNNGAFSSNGLSPAVNQTGDPAQRDVGQYSGRTLLSAGVNISRPLAELASANVGVVYTSILFDDSQYQSSQDLSAQLGLQYQITGKTAVGLRGSYGTLSNEQNADQIYQNISLTSSYQATGKVMLTASSGVDFRQYGDLEPNASDSSPANPYAASPYGQEDSTNFVFDLRANYQIRVRTSLFVGANRGVTGSAIQGNSAVLRNALNLGLSQRIGDRLGLSLVGGYEFSESSTLQPAGESTVDADPMQYWTSRANLSYQLNSYCNLGLFYEHRNNEGGSNGLTFSGNRFGLSAGIAF